MPHGRENPGASPLDPHPACVYSVYVGSQAKNTAIAKRINVILPETTLKTIDRLVQKGERSRLIDKAVRHYVATRSPEVLRQQLQLATIRDRDLDSEIALDWIAVDNEWQHIDPRNEKETRASGRAAGKSTSRRSTRQ